MNQNVSLEIRQLPEEMHPQTAPGVWEAVLALLPLTSGSVLVAGAGRGGLSLLLAKRGFEVTSLDLHPAHFAAPGLACQHADFNEPIALETERFDAVVAVEVIEHLESPWKFLREALRLIKVGGSLIVTTPNVVSLPARLSFLRSAQLPYFRRESFVGCYHVTPIFPWAVERWAETTNASVKQVTYSRANWPDKRDIPRTWERPWMVAAKHMLPVGALFGEITCFHITKTADVGTVTVGVHTK